MTVTTVYGHWNIGSTLNIEQYIVRSLNDENLDDYDLDAIESDLREAIAANLPEGVSLVGSEVFGPYYDRPETPLDENGEETSFLDAALDAIGEDRYWGIVFSHVKGAS